MTEYLADDGALDEIWSKTYAEQDTFLDCSVDLERTPKRPSRAHNYSESARFKKARYQEQFSGSFGGLVGKPSIGPDRDRQVGQASPIRCPARLRFELTQRRLSVLI